MPKSRVDFFKEVLEEMEFCGCRHCIQEAAELLDEAAAKHRAQYRGDRPSAVDELKSTPEGLAAYNRAKADLARTAEIEKDFISRLRKYADRYDALAITYQDKTSATVAQIKRQAILEAAEKLHDGDI